MRMGMGSVRGLGGCTGLPLDVQTVYNLARSAGFAPQMAQSMVAIAQRESGLNPNCFTSSLAGSTEASYGLWQINMQGAAGPQRRALFGISDNSQLLDPATNAMAAYRLSGGSNLTPWHIDSDVGNIKQADGSIKAVNLGYRTKYLSNLAALPPPDQLEAGYSGLAAPGIVSDISSDDSVTQYEDTSDPSGGVAAPGDTSTIAMIGIGLGLVYFLSR